MPNQNPVEDVLVTYSQRILGDVKILMIEDDVFFSKMVLEKLALHGCIPYSTPNGDEGLLLADRFQPHVIILDLMLPGMSGEEVLIKLKANDSTKNIPVIVFSNKSEEKDINENMANGAAEYLVKSSTDLSELARVVQRIVTSNS
jgi:DNA-binding response OmpR family regulator